MADTYSTTMTVTVVTVTPSLTVISDGSDTAVHAKLQDGVTGLVVGDRVQITVRTPHEPLVTGKVTV